VVDALTKDEARRYARQIVLKDFGGIGQQKLKAARVLVVGAGGLGSPVITYLAAAGVGMIGIVDDDHVAISNLQRQIAHGMDDLGRLKTESARDAALRINPLAEIVLHSTRLDADNAERIFAGYDLVLDGTDNLTARRATAAAASAKGLPLVSGAVSMFDGQLTVFMPDGPSFSSVYPETLDSGDLPSCEAMGVLGPAVGVIGSLMAVEAIKILTGVGEPLVGRLMLYDGRSGRFTELGY
jgi:molybdopterin/thiamine biosynthesis adenylyltransferase